MPHGPAAGSCSGFSGLAGAGHTSTSARAIVIAIARRMQYLPRLDVACASITTFLRRVLRPGMPVAPIMSIARREIGECVMSDPGGHGAVGLRGGRGRRSGCLPQCED